MTTYNLDPAFLSCRFKFNTWWMDLPPSSRQDVKQDTEAMAVLLLLGFLTQKAISASEKVTKADCPELPQQPLSSEVAANIMKVKGQFWYSCHQLLYSKTDSRGSIRKSAVFEFIEMGSDTQQLSR